MTISKARLSSGINVLDQLLGGLFIGDNVVLYDDAGSLAFGFCLKFIQETLAQNKPMVYVSFDRSPKTLLEDLGPLSASEHLTVVDCFTHGKGDGSSIFRRFYDDPEASSLCRIIKVESPENQKTVSNTIYEIHRNLTGDVRFVFESLTGMQDLWNGEDSILKFYSRSCPRLYELETVAYWIIEKNAHSSQLRAHINQIAQVAIDLALKRGKSTLTIRKAHKRSPSRLNKPELFWMDGDGIRFDSDRHGSGQTSLGDRLRSQRMKRGMSQKELATHVGVTPSTISQIESNQIYPSVPALMKIAQILSVEISYFFNKNGERHKQSIFDGSGTPVHFPEHPKGSIKGAMLLPEDHPAELEPYRIEIPPGKKLSSHFFNVKGEEFGYVLSGRLTVLIGEKSHELQTGDVLHLTSDIPTQWKNTGKETARLLWIK